MQIETFFNKTLQQEFKQQIPTLRATLGQRSFDPQERSYGIGGNTYRALGRYEKAPSPVYQDWAKRQLKKIDGAFLEQQAKSRSDYLVWHSYLVTSLERFWQKEMNAPLSFAHSHKLVDLFVKWLSHYNFEDSRATELLITHANCALDRQTLTKLNACLSDALPMVNPSMGDVSCHNTYLFCQDAIGEFAESCGGTRLLFDCFGWSRGG